MLSLHTLAEEWQSDVLDELEIDDDVVCGADIRRENWANLPDPEATLPLTADERAELNESNQEFIELCESIGCDASPDALRNHAEDILIADDEFANYTREYAADLSEVDLASWPCMYIDWERAANDFRADFEEVTFRGIVYLIRAC